MKLAIGCDEAGFELKQIIMEFLKEKGVDFDDVGCYSKDPVLYPEVAEKLALAVSEGKYDRGILICGTGIGMAITANKIPGVRAACCHDVYSAERSRKSNDAQILTLGARVIGVELAKSLVEVWLNSEFSGGRSLPKVEKMNEIDAKYRR
ncbi:MAG TPA: ribose 5-phosphate isomerase B [Thermoanaerobacterales bacterium]|nr:ribose 5-phosphate isomerase B [Thermoanaerobacterales bacterium]